MAFPICGRQQRQLDVSVTAESARGCADELQHEIELDIANALDAVCTETEDEASIFGPGYSRCRFGPGSQPGYSRSTVSGASAVAVRHHVMLVPCAYCSTVFGAKGCPSGDGPAVPPTRQCTRCINILHRSCAAAADEVLTGVGCSVFDDAAVIRGALASTEDFQCSSCTAAVLWEAEAAAAEQALAKQAAAAFTKHAAENAIPATLATNGLPLEVRDTGTATSTSLLIRVSDIISSFAAPHAGRVACSAWFAAYNPMLCPNWAFRGPAGPGALRHRHDRCGHPDLPLRRHEHRAGRRRSGAAGTLL